MKTRSLERRQISTGAFHRFTWGRTLMQCLCYVRDSGQETKFRKLVILDFQATFAAYSVGFSFMWPCMWPCVWPCIVTNLYLIKPTRRTNFPNFVSSKDSTFFGHFLCQSSGVFYCTFDIVTFLAGLMRASMQGQAFLLFIMADEYVRFVLRCRHVLITYLRVCNYLLIYLLT